MRAFSTAPAGWPEGWRATAGTGARLPVEAVDGALLGVRLGPGAGRVELRYRPRGLAAGAAVSLAALLGLLVALAVIARPFPRDAGEAAGRYGAAGFVARASPGGGGGPKAT